MPLTILEGSTFCICDEIGDVKGPSLGFFADDTRFLSRCILTVNGARPLLLSGGKAEYYSAGFFLRNPVAGELSQDEVSIARERFVGDGMQDRLLVQNHADRTVELELALELGHRLRRHLRRQGARLRARGSDARSAAAPARCTERTTRD